MPLVDGGTQRLPRVVGMGRALELILTGRPVEAEEALRIGLVNEVVEPGAHLERALELAERIASFPRRRCSPTAAPRSRAPACRSPRASPSSIGSAARTLDGRRPRRRPLRRRRGRHGEGSDSRQRPCLPRLPPMKIGIVGLGYVGLPLAVAFAEAGHEVVGLDSDPRKVEALNAGRSHIEDIPDATLARRSASVCGRPPTTPTSPPATR